MQKKLSSFDVYVIVSELQDLIGSYIDKIYQIRYDEVLIKFRNVKTRKKEAFFIKKGGFICVTDKQVETPMRPFDFAMILRKHLQNGRIGQISQHEFDRVIKIKIDKRETGFTLVVEFFSEGNIILLDQNNKIIAPLTSQVWAHRKIKKNELYLPPPSQINPFDLTPRGFIKIVRQSKTDLVRTLAVKINLGGVIAEEICKRADVDKNKKIAELKEEDLNNVYRTFKLFLKVFRDKDFKPLMIKEKEEIIDIIPFNFEIYSNNENKRVPSFTRAFEALIEKRKPVEEEKTVAEHVDRLKRRLLQQKKAIDRFNEEIKKKKLEGELIYLNYDKINTLLKEIKEVLNKKNKEKDIERINKKNNVKVFDPVENLLIVYLKDPEGNKFEVELNFRKNVEENAEEKYNQNKNLRDKLIGAKRSVEKTKKELEKAYADVLKEKKITEEKIEKTRGFWFEKYRWFISSDGNLVIAGRDSKTNEEIVKKYLRSSDRYVHADIRGAPSCVVKNHGLDNKELPISEQTLKEACVFAASYSKAWKQYSEGEAYWVLPEQVSKTPRSGEFVPKGAFIIRGKRNYQRCELKIAVGLIDINGEKKLMAGPVEAVKNRADKYVVFKPGHVKKNVIAAEIAKKLNVSVDNVNSVLPPGGLSVVETKNLSIDKR